MMFLYEILSILVPSVILQFSTKTTEDKVELFVLCPRAVDQIAQLLGKATSDVGSLKIMLF